MTSVRRELVAVGGSVIREQHHSCVLRLGDIGQEIEPGVEVEQETLGVSLLGSNIVGSLERVSNKEHGEVEADQIVIAFRRIELRCMTPGVTSRVGVLSLYSQKCGVKEV
jgi:hypothetical protein